MDNANVLEIPLNKIKVSRNSRLTVKDSDLSELMSSIKQTGLLQPIGVIKKGSGYEICYGNRRFLACSKLGWTKIRATVHEESDTHDSDIKNLTENIQRRNISLAEAGRYIDILTKEGLTSKEVAARLGVSVGYVGNCLDAYKRVPKEFRDDLEVRVSAKKPTPGKISIRTAQNIISAKSSYKLDDAQVKSLFKAAKTSDKFNPDNVPKYARAMKAGKQDFLNAVEPLKSMKIQFLITAKEYDRLKREYIDEGVFRSMNALFVAVITGKKSIRIKVENQD